jgi:antibiotic biosynthesis monooxygenase
MYTSIRRYNLKPDSTEEVIRRSEKGFLPIVTKSPGFLAYDLVNTGNNTLTTISTFEDRTGAEQSNKLVEGWVKDNLASLVTEPPMIMSGEIGVHRTK